ncbi:aspartate/glutamate racemase family protein [Sporomusa acidovorans]|uniref:Asp/Glu/hydantoin racemase n=1 Tax=Sporomusa acidovorans (strain ATCC 49682 / DSM 3132 / Mol) TaxID=1123286 RepID=A0ABZ3J1F4_SPOA4|nr:aspartate/glutamate racemase family protein [Sporomusa acidovorans]OZC16552.1 Asp/Glu/hydantoin racemase [Sporomusa acidovorans DSM 3132]SDF60927.1 Aspartate/glutamate racemase [Sporomusa acidovorans]
MGIKIGLIHTTRNSMQPINEAFHKHAPEVSVLNFLDEGLMEEINKHNIITRQMTRRLICLLDKAERSGVDGILLACSAFSPYVDDMKKLFDVPVLSADISMLEQAIQIADRIGVIATVGTAGPTTTRLLQDIAKQRHKEVKVYTEIVTEAFAALKAGDEAKHNQLIQQKILELSACCNAVVLAQMSMTRALTNFSQTTIPILTSPEISVKAILAQITKKLQ